MIPFHGGIIVIAIIIMMMMTKTTSAATTTTTTVIIIMMMMMRLRMMTTTTIIMMMMMIIIIIIIMMMMMMMMITTIIIIMMMVMIMMIMMMMMMMMMIALKGAIRDYFFNLRTAPRTVSNTSAQVVRRDRVQITCNASGAHHVQQEPRGTEDSSAIKFDTVEIVFILVLFYWLKRLTDESLTKLLLS